MNVAATLPPTSDVVIIGGGIMGASIAWHLARRKAGAVTLLERSTIASGASGKTGALLRQHYSNRPEATLAHLSLHVFRHWPDIVGGECGFEESGLIFTLGKSVERERNLASLRANVEMQQEIGIRTAMLVPDDLLALQTFLDTTDLLAATWEPESGYVNAVTGTRSMARAAIAAGASVVEQCPVLRLL